MAMELGFRVVEQPIDLFGWLPGSGYYIVGPEYDGSDHDEYLAFCGGLEDPQAKLDAELIASLLNRVAP